MRKKSILMVAILLTLICSCDSNQNVKIKSEKFIEAEQFYKSGDYTRVIMYCESMLEEDSINAEVYNLMGKSKFHSSDNMYGINDFRKAIRINSELAESYFYLGFIENSIENMIKPTRGCENLMIAKKLGYTPTKEFGQWNFLFANCD